MIIYISCDTKLLPYIINGINFVSEIMSYKSLVGALY